jgi:hypothetical protein
MNSHDLAELLPRIAAHIEEIDDFRQVLPAGPQPDQGGVFTAREGDVVLALAIRGDAQLMITAAVAVDVSFTDDLLSHLNQLNGTMLLVGRLFAKQYDGEGAGMGAVMLQEVMESEYFDSGPSVNVILTTFARVGAMASRVALEIRSRHGGQPVHPENWMQVVYYA